MLKVLRKTIDRNVDHYGKELENIKRSQSKLDNSITKVKTNLEAVNRRLNETRKQISYLEDRIMEITQSEHQTEGQIKKNKKQKRKQHMRSMG